MAGFEDNLSDEQQRVAEQIVAGSTDNDSGQNLGLAVETVRKMKAEIRQKGIEHLV